VLSAICCFASAQALAAPQVLVRNPRVATARERKAYARLIEAPKNQYRSEPNVKFRARDRLSGRTDGADTIKVLCLRVEFQEDTSSLSTGNGRMDLAGFLDPSYGLFYDPPHTKLYFEKLMQSLHNYLRTNSLGRCFTETRVMPEAAAGAYQLPHDMLYYGDTISMYGVETGLTRLMRDAIRVADEDPAIRFSDYDLFVIFHAGSTYQSDMDYDTPFDLFTGTIGENALLAYLGQPYILADEGQTQVTAAAIMPEMSRQDTMYEGMTNLAGMTGLEGALYHEFCHLLGAYDEYDVSGRSMGIGSWSLMGNGGWNGSWATGAPPGTIPSLLDPYHKILFGWFQPTVVRMARESIPLFCAEMETTDFARHGDSTSPLIIKVPITPKEYYLIENRQADVKHKDTLFVHVEYGIPVSVGDGEYDFFQPGSGVLVWHIDDSVITELGPFNAINYFSNHKGVDLVEGDGIQDFDGISGRSDWDYQTVGSKHDPFFVGGYNDTLSAYTVPSSDGYYGKTYITVGVLAVPDTVMPTSVSFDLSQPGFPADPVRKVPFNPATWADLARTGQHQYLVTDTAGRVSAWNADGTTFLPGHTNGSFTQLANASTHAAPVAGDIAGDSLLEVVCAADNKRLYAFTAAGTTVPGFPRTAGDRITATPVLADLDGDGKQEIIVGATDGLLYIWKGDGTSFPGFPLRLQYRPGSAPLEIRAAVALTDPANPRIVVLASDGTVFLVNLDATIAPGFPKSVGLGSLYTYAAPVVGDIDRDSNKEIAVVVSGGLDYKVVVLDLGGNIRYQSRAEIRFPFSGTPALADVNQDGYLEVLLTSKNCVYAFNRTGTLVTNYPFVQESTYQTTEIAGNWLITYDKEFLFTSSPVVADVDGDGVLDILVGSPRYGVLAFNGITGRQLTFSPLSTLGSISATPLVCDVDSDGRLELAVGSDDGLFRVWKLPAGPGLVAWPGFLRDPAHTGSYPDSILPVMNPQNLPIADKFYIYPNPAEKLATARFHLGNVTGASARIQILDVSGLPLVEMTAPAFPNSDNEQRFDSRLIPSGVYIVRLEVKSDQGRAVKFYKLGIVR
jgi:M6 family metalloprotease-like protein